MLAVHNLSDHGALWVRHFPRYGAFEAFRVSYCSSHLLVVAECQLDDWCHITLRTSLPIHGYLVQSAHLLTYVLPLPNTLNITPTKAPF
jgi:hypothetical protein